jgi:hypothetical protein
MRSPYVQDIWCKDSYREIVPPERIVVPTSFRVLIAARDAGRANHQDQVTPSHLPGGNAGSRQTIPN